MSLDSPARQSAAALTDLPRVIHQVTSDAPGNLARLESYLRQPSISATDEGIDATCRMLVDDLVALGGNARVVPGRELPIVYGRFDVGAERTVLVHSMYDTVPADEPDWLVDPFSAARMEWPGVGECIVGRGAEDTKSAVALTLNGIAAYQAAGIRLPVNVLVVLEASELGSGSIGGFVEHHIDELRQADVVYWPWMTGRADGTPVVHLGAKGLMTFKLRCKGGAWGGPGRADLHGSHAAWIASPAFELVQALATMRDRTTGDVAIAGYYDETVEPTSAERELVHTLARQIDADTLRQSLGIERFCHDSLEEAIAAHCFSSQFNISGLKTGLVIEGGHKVVLPHEAVASLDLRPVRGMSCERIASAIRNHLDNHGFPHVHLEVLNCYRGGGTARSDPAVETLIETYRAMGCDPEIWPTATTAIAVSLWTERLGRPWITSAPGYAAGAHAANERVSVEGFQRACEFVVRLLWGLSQAPPAVDRVGGDHGKQ